MFFLYIYLYMYIYLVVIFSPKLFCAPTFHARCTWVCRHFKIIMCFVVKYFTGLLSHNDQRQRSFHFFSFLLTGVGWNMKNFISSIRRSRFPRIYRRFFSFYRESVSRWCCSRTKHITTKQMNFEFLYRQKKNGILWYCYLLYCN